jgi:hypothetical protein
LSSFIFKIFRVLPFFVCVGQLVFRGFMFLSIACC